MNQSLAPYTDHQLRTFLDRVRTHDLLALLQTVTLDDLERLLDLLSPASADFVRERLLRPLSPRSNLLTAERLLERIAHHDDTCIFCHILAGESPASCITRDDDIAAFMDLYPVTQGHLLIIPTRHTARLEDIAPDIAARMMQLAQKLGQAVLQSDLGCDGYNLFLANGGAAGQDIFHVHLHILPRHHADGFGFIFPPHYPQQAERAALDAQAAMFKTLL